MLPEISIEYNFVAVRTQTTHSTWLFLREPYQNDWKYSLLRINSDFMDVNVAVWQERVMAHSGQWQKYKNIPNTNCNACNGI